MIGEQQNLFLRYLIISVGSWLQTSSKTTNIPKQGDLIQNFMFRLPKELTLSVFIGPTKWIN